MRNNRRTVRELGIVAIVLALVVGIVVSAVQAEGQRIVRPETNDGGAWLIKQDRGSVGHVNRSASEITGRVNVAGNNELIDTEQSGSTVVVTNQTTNELTVVDARTFQTSNRVQVPSELQVKLVNDDAILWTESPLTVWKVTLEALNQMASLDEASVFIDDPGAGLVEVTRFGTMIALASESGLLYFAEAEATAAVPIALDAMGPEVVGLTASGDDAVLLTRAGALMIIPAGTDEPGDPIAFGNVVALGQPTLPGEPIIGVTDDGSVVSVDPAGSSDVIAVSAGRADGAGPLRPIFHRGCVFAVTTTPPELTRSCNGVAGTPEPLTGITGASLRLRLINNWVWVNDLRTGALWVINEDTPLDRIDDWGAALGDDTDTGDESNEVEDGKREERNNPDAADAEVIRADEIDEDDVNDSPIARDDMATTRVDLPTVVPVLRNDEDPDGDILLVTLIDGVPEGVIAAATADRRAIQVTPRAGFVGEFSFSYTISDGRGGTDSARVTVEVVDPVVHENRPPVAVTDVATALAGANAQLNVLDNDSDPDGDALILVDVVAPSGSVTFDGSGQVTYRPDPTSGEGTIPVEYTMRDTFGLTATGSIKVLIRLPGSNSPPDARNDAAVTVVGNPVTLNVLLNDSDPDNDALSVTSPPTLLSGPVPTEPPSLTADGQMFFVSDDPGEYLFSYTVTDGPDSDTAAVRIDVAPAVDNRPPVAIRDDITIARGATATAYVLANDTDPDGDVVSIESWEPSDFASIESFRGIGFVIEVAPDAPDQIEFRYTITDGINDGSTGIVVVAVASNSGVNQNPVVAPDTIEVRPGSTASVRVLLNDFDPEGSPLRIGQVSDVAGADLRIGPAGQEILVTLDDDTINGFTFAYDALDDVGNRSGTFVDVRIVPDDGVNRPPIARADTARTRTRIPVTIPAVSNDFDPDGDLIRIESIAAQPTAGVATLGDDGTITYTPDAGFRGTDRFRYVLIDQFGDRSIGNVLVGVIAETEENRPPTAVDDTYTVIAGGDVALFPIVANDFDPDGDTLRISRTTVADTISVTDDKQSIRFTPPVGIERDSVAVTVRYTVDDGRGGTADAVVTITVTNAIEPESPRAFDDSVGPVKPGTSVTLAVLDNDSDPDGRRDELVVTSNDAAGTVDPATQTITYIAGPESSTHDYTITDAQGLTDRARVIVLVDENVAPVLTPLVVTTPYEEPVVVSLAGQVTDPDDDELFFVCCDQVRGGSTAITASDVGVFDVTYTPDPEFAGQAGFSYSVDDQNGHEVSGAVVVNVLPKENSAPTATDIVASIEAGTVGTIDVSANADDVDISTGDVLTFAVSNESDDDISATNNVVTISPAIDQGGTTRTFDYEVTDSDGLTATATVTIDITESQRPAPLAVDDVGATTQGVEVIVDVIGNDLDELGDGLRVISAGSTTPVGTITWDELGGTITYLPQIEFFGTASINYRIEDSRQSVGGQSTATLTIDVVGFPGVPPTPEAVADNATATITWEQPAANGGPIDEFEVESDQGQSVILPTSSSHTFNGLTNGIDHRFRIRAHNEAGWGEWSELSLPVRPDIEPSRPAAPTVVFDDEALQVSWSEPANDGSAVDGYILEIGGGDSDLVTLGAVETYPWTGLDNGTSYQFRVIAQNLSGNSDVSPWSNTEHPLREPDATEPIVTTRGDQYLDLAWTEPNLNGDPIIEYQLERQADPGNLVSATTRSYRWADLPNGLEQAYRVRSRNRDVDWSPWSQWSIPVKPCGVPLAPTGLTATRGDTLAGLTWNEAAPNGCDIQSYTVQSLNDNTTQTINGAVTSGSFTGLQNGQQVNFRIRANNEEGAGAWSAPSNSVTPAGPPFRIDTLTIEPQPSLGEMSYTFTAPGRNGADITRYELRVTGGGIETATITNGVDATTPIGARSALAPGTTYSFEVRACNNIGCATQWSNIDTDTTFGPPSRPTGLVGSGGNLWVQWNWNAVSADPRLPVRYEIAEIPFDGVPFSARDVGSSTSYRNSGYVTAFGTHDARVRACNAIGCSPYTGVVSATAVPAVGNVISFGGSAQGVQDCTSPNCRWISLNITGYQPNNVYTTTCYNLTLGQPVVTVAITTNSSGAFSDSTFCYVDQLGHQYRVLTLGGDSNVITL